jgi:hypothetical protein
MALLKSLNEPGSVFDDKSERAKAVDALKCYCMYYRKLQREDPEFEIKGAAGRVEESLGCSEITTFKTDDYEYPPAILEVFM